MKPGTIRQISPIANIGKVIRETWKIFQNFFRTSSILGTEKFNLSSKDLIAVIDIGKNKPSPIHEKIIKESEYITAAKGSPISNAYERKRF